MARNLKKPIPPIALSMQVGMNLKKLRNSKDLSLDQLAKLSSVSRAMLAQIEAAKSAPTITLLWKIAHALEVPFSALLADDNISAITVLRADQSKSLESSQGRFRSRALFPMNQNRRTEFYELRIAPKHTEFADAHSSGTTENLVVTQGTVEVCIAGEEPKKIQKGDALFFKADVAHSYKNCGKGEALLYLVMTYSLPVEGARL